MKTEVEQVNISDLGLWFGRMYPELLAQTKAQTLGQCCKKHKDSDSPRYKALGNSIAIPPWLYVLSKLSLCCGEDHTMASLFDGIGGFPYIWELLHGKGYCLWASEIEEFPIAVTKIHFPEVENENQTNG